MNLVDAYTAVAELNQHLQDILSQEDVKYDIRFKNHFYEFEAIFLIEDQEQQDNKRNELIRALLHDHFTDIINHVTLKKDEMWTPSNLIVDILCNEDLNTRPEDATMEIVSEVYEVEDKETLAIENRDS
jgi:hypothetical protein